MIFFKKNYLLHISFLLLFTFSISSSLWGQRYLLRTNAISSATTCAGFIYDSGGADANYSDNSDSRITIFPTQSGFVTSVSGTIWTEVKDTLIIYDGDGITGTILFKGASPSNGMAVNVPTCRSTSGPLTVRFITDASGNEQGVELMITCIDMNNYEEEPIVHDTVACIDYTDLYADNVVCTYGTFANPYQNIGVVPGRHTVMTDVNAIDPYTYGGLPCVCPGDLASVRLGDNNTGSQAESITYTYHVDTSNYDILLLKYAPVMQDPSHSTNQQPKFTFVILDPHDMPIDPVCGAAEFIPGYNTHNWHDGSSTVKWKDWTYVGIDLTAYHQQTIKIRITTYDCSPTAHFGYAYFSFDCKKRSIKVETCGNISQNTYTAPDGFTYRWYYQSNPGTTLSTNQSYTAIVGDRPQTLLCDVAFIDNANCKFTMAVNVAYRFPLADFTYNRIGCSNTLQLQNTSTTSSDGITPDGTGSPCETAYWSFGNGATSNLYSPNSITYPTPGTYTITMIAGLADNRCLDTVSKTVTVFPNTVVITGNDTICMGDSLTLSVEAGDYVYWNTGDTTTLITVSPISTRTYTVAVTTQDGCFATGNFTVNVMPTYSSENEITLHNNETYNFGGQIITGTGVYYQYLQTANGCDSTIKLTVHHFIDEYVSICSTDVYNFRGRDLTEPGVYTDSIRLPNGCDSVYTIHLSVNPIYFSQTNHSMCDDAFYIWNGDTLSNLSAGLHNLYDTLQTVHGCDSIFYLRLIVRPTTRIRVYDTICQGETFRFLTYSYTEEGIYYETTPQANGCNRIYEVHLKVHPTYLFTDTVYICDNQSYNFRGRLLTHAGIYYDSLLSSKGCDSIYKLDLRINPSYLFETSASICDNQTYNFRGQVLTQPGVYYDSLLTSRGCDSVYKLTLQVSSTYLFETSTTICDNQTYNFRGQTLTQSGVYYDSLISSLGCDSVYKLNLQVNPTYLFETSATICDNQTYNFRGQVLTQPGIYYDSLVSTLGCDSIYRQNLYVNATFFNSITVAIPDNGSYNFRGQILTQSGVYYDSLVSSLGCD
ncbi:MAG TPA: hypothetical protein PK448_06315, partial [Bacteroidales bacterium]|nr:hypothetical protein [Bacteroidales bacterium]